MPWSVWIAAALIISTFTDIGALLIVIATSPWIAIPGSIAIRSGIKIESAWPFGIAVGGVIILLAALAFRKPRDPFLILILGILIAATLSFNRIGRWKGI
jgi:hypothetical protein